MAQDNDTSNHEGINRQEQQDLQNPQQMNAELARAFQELARGEQTASALESKLDTIESRIEQLLASVEESARQQQAMKDSRSDETGKADSSSNQNPGS